MTTNFNGYLVLPNGEVYNKKGKRMSTQVTNSGYELVHFWNNGKRKAYTIHRLVAMVHIPNPDNKLQVNHRDGNKLNNTVENLEWTTLKENSKHAWDAGIMENAREKARQRMSAIGKDYAHKNTANLLAKNIAVSIPIIQLSISGEFIKEYPSIRAARRATGSQHIKNVLAGKCKQSKGFKWAYK